MGSFEGIQAEITGGIIELERTNGSSLGQFFQRHHVIWPVYGSGVSFDRYVRGWRAFKARSLVVL